MLNVVTNKVACLLGKDETTRFLNVSLFQGASASKKAPKSLALVASDNPLAQTSEALDPTLFCTAFKRARFYLFTRSEPESDPRTRGGGDRDVLNEKPTREEASIASAQSAASKARAPAASEAVLHTTMGDIHLRLFPEQVPKTVENFTGLARKGYYDGVIFHRIIKKFMLQTGDPLGDGTGGESLWGREFEDEFVKGLRHDRPYTLSMANAGANTNGAWACLCSFALRFFFAALTRFPFTAPRTQAVSSSSPPSQRLTWTTSTPSLEEQWLGLT